MAVFIEVISGVLGGARFELKEGMIIGRIEGDIVINDAKISSKHAQVALGGNGGLNLVDLDSSNGLKIDGNRVREISLSHGISFEIGRTEFKIQVVEDPVEIMEDAPLRPLSWRTTLANKLLGLVDEIPRNVSTVERFSPPLKLSFYQGIQAGQEIVLGYGGRTAGASSLDIELLDNAAPSHAFELKPVPGGAQIKVLALGKVYLNNMSIESEVLKDGDIISIGKSLIRINYL
jgi:pSer/pThr/pTyr-binding forkhead associated (FHA) protein